ncbi:Uncharacterised protein [Salmonella enterica subsp. arizonae]|uniref:Uncharacterized protein n=1 Tax=Salmonella enterica subsp. arizonae TaxID=59203 RepID=A0A379RZ27_SALER|nr:Uncharacterised protein [Salmonella enterica subsp. arizonae]
MSDDISMGFAFVSRRTGCTTLHAGGCNELPGSQQDAAHLQYCLVGQ